MYKDLLLKEDQDRLDYLSRYLIDKENEIYLNKESTPKKIYSQFDLRDLDSKVIISQLRGEKKTMRDIVIDSCNNYHNEYRVCDFEITEKDCMMIFKGSAYLISDHFLSVVREIKYLERLKKDAHKMILKEINDPSFDSRNIIIDEEGVWKCDRLKNTEDARLIGELVKKELIISRERYENNLLLLKRD